VGRTGFQPVFEKAAGLLINLFISSRLKTAFALIVLGVDLALAQFPRPESRGVINDPDGFTNVRTQPSEQAAIAARVKVGEIFKYKAAEKEGWWKVTLASGKTGWMHSSRIRMFFVPEDLIVAENDEANIYARTHGIDDYLSLVRAAAKKDPRAMQKFFGLGCDGAACDTHFEIAIRLIHILGDDTLAKFLTHQSSAYLEKVTELVTNDIALPPFEPVSYTKRNFPKTARLLFPH